MPPKPRRLDRDRLCKLLGLLESDHDGEVVNAARRAAALLREAGTTWSEIIALPPASDKESEDLARLDALLAAANVADVLKIRLRAMRAALRNGKLPDQDRRLMRVLHRKAVIDGAIVDP